MNHTTSQFHYFEKLYKYYNQKLFANKLPDILINISRQNKVSGTFSSNRWFDRHTGNYVHEITINPEAIKESFDIDFHQTLVHEMCHLWQEEFGKAGRKGYHNKEWANKMISIGLMPSDVGSEGGKITGQNMADYFIEDGQFIMAFKRLQEGGFEFMPLEPNNAHLYCREIQDDGTIKFLPVEKPKKTDSKAGVRVKYSCECGNNIWGKSGLRAYCLECRFDFLAN